MKTFLSRHPEVARKPPLKPSGKTEDTGVTQNPGTVLPWAVEESGEEEQQHIKPDESSDKGGCSRSDTANGESGGRSPISEASVAMLAYALARNPFLHHRLPLFIFGPGI